MRHQVFRCSLDIGLVSYAGFTITFQSTADQIGVPLLAFTFGAGYLSRKQAFK